MVYYRYLMKRQKSYLNDSETSQARKEVSMCYQLQLDFDHVILLFSTAFFSRLTPRKTSLSECWCRYKKKFVFTIRFDMKKDKKEETMNP